MKRGKNLFKKLLIMTVVTMMTIIALPKGVWAETISKKGSGSATIKKGSTVTFDAVEDTTWSTSNSNISLSTTSGNSCVITGNEPGTATVTVYSGEDAATITITVEDIAFTSNPANITIGGSSTTATVSASNGSDQSSSVVWSQSSSNGGEVTFDKTTGATVNITAKTAGNVRITATYDQVYVYYDITVGGSSASITGLSNQSIVVGGTSIQTATVSPASSDKIAWESSNTSVATVSASGTNNEIITVNGVSAGTAVITGTYKGKDANFTVTVSEASITLNKTSIENLIAGNTDTLTATVAPSSLAGSITWETSDSTVASISGSGNTVTINAIAAGTATIKAKSTIGGVPKEASCTVKVINNLALSIAVAPTSGTVVEGKTLSLTATPNPSNASPVDYEWTSSSPLNATVSGTGNTAVVTGVKATPEGTPVTITVTEKKSGKTAKATITVIAGIPISKLSIANAPIYATKGESIKISLVTPTPSGYTTLNDKIKWYLGDTQVGTGLTITLDSSKVSVGSSASLVAKIEAADNYGSPVSSESATVYRYDAPSASYSYGSRKITMKFPEGVGSDDTWFKPTGYYVALVYNDKEIDNAKGDSTSEISSELLEKFITNNADKFKNDPDTIKFRVYPRNGSTKSNNIALETESIKVYKVTTSAGDGIASTTPSTTYGLEGQKITIGATAKSGYSFSTWSPSSAVTDSNVANTTLTVSTSSSNNKVTARGAANSTTNGAGNPTATPTGKPGNPNLDKVPKTGEGRDVFIMWMILIISCIAVGVLLFVQHNQKVAIMKAAGMGANSDNGINTKSTNKKN